MDAIERALDVALIVMENGGSTSNAERTFRNVLRGYKQEGGAVGWRLDLVTVSGVGDGRTSTIVRAIGPIGVNLVRASAAAVLGERVARGEIEPAALPAEIERVRALPPPYGRVAMVLASAFTSAFICRLLGGDLPAVGIAFAAGSVGAFARSVLRVRGLRVAPLTIVCGFVSASLAGLGLRLGLSPAVGPTLIASVFYMVPGIPLINGFVDMVSYKHLLIGIERIANAAFLFLALAVAVAFAYSFII
jgi:uncharacterized membrane protein YjjP (DUF1212 family)